ncbi:helix-turn-helix domain-containing protein [Virgibacillus necropolis]|uniref:Helix-turn-helix domain-containing protein n=1 Tax=Virgibacillus necropolis TaxID=163877 RepID=A0A221MF30_9BACI|nr:helix-turn-helix domain-containing protein [Virgibacillus necropolis]ASN06210.1 hypothetical protein CFK40_14855 [Virgibacillus necropolis]
MERQTLTVKEVANYLGVHTDTIYLMANLKQIPHLKFRNRILFPKESIDLWIQDQEFLNILKRASFDGLFVMPCYLEGYIYYQFQTSTNKVFGINATTIPILLPLTTY